MNRAISLKPGEDAIDRFARDLVQNPERAEDLKLGLRKAIGAGGQRDRTPVEISEPEDLWDNVPV